MVMTTKVINLKGNPKNPESAQHIITFPGGSIELSRTSTNTYWVHMAVHKGQLLDDIPSQSKHGTVIAARVDRVYPFGGSRCSLDNLNEIQHVAIEIQT